MWTESLTPATKLPKLFLCASLTDSDMFLGEESVDFMNIPHKLSISKCEVRHVSPSLCRGHQLNQRWKSEKQNVISIISTRQFQNEIINV